MAKCIRHVLTPVQEAQHDMDADDLTRTDQAILDVLKRGEGGQEPWGRATKGYLIQETQFSRNSIYNRLDVLEAAGYIRELHGPTRLFEFVTDPRDGGS